MGSNSNLSLQCSVCGQWKRLTGKDENGHEVRRFYPCCGKNGEINHDKDVCDDCCKLKCPYRIKPKNTVIIYYIWWAKGHGIPKNWYCSEINESVKDYHLKSVLIKNAEKDGLPWQIIRYHRKGGGVSVVAKSA